jgi:tetratricopeptide (TPR) repeat protein
MKTIWPKSLSAFCLLLAVVFAIAGTRGHSQSPVPQAEPTKKPPARFDNIVRDDFFAGMFGGNQARFDRAMKFTEDALAKDPKNGDAHVWHGSALMFLSSRAYTEGDTKKGDELWSRGLNEMDEGVALEPDNVGVHIGRGAPLLGIAMSVGDPDDTQTRAVVQKAVGDYEFAFSKQRPHFANLPVHARGELLFGLAGGWSLLGNEQKTRAYLEEIVKECPDSDYATEAQSLLVKTPLAHVEHTCIVCHED